MTAMPDDEMANLATLCARACKLEIPEVARAGVLLNTRILMGHMDKVLAFAVPAPEGTSDPAGEAG